MSVIIRIAGITDADLLKAINATDEDVSNIVSSLYEMGFSSLDYIQPMLDERPSVPPGELEQYDNFNYGGLGDMATACQNVGNTRGVDFLLDAMNTYKKMTETGYSNDTRE